MKTVQSGDPLTVLKGIGEKSAALFAKTGIETIGGLLAGYPVHYEQFTKPGNPEDYADGQMMAVCGFLRQSPALRFGGGMKILAGMIETPYGQLEVLWFNMPYLKNQIKTGTSYVFRGRIKERGRKKVLTQPALFSPEDYESKCQNLLPVYSLTAGLTNQAVTKAVRQALALQPFPLKDYLPESLRMEEELIGLEQALWQIHFPRNEEEMQQARRRLVFDEFLLFILALKQLKSGRLSEEHEWVLKEGKWPGQVISRLPYALTEAQQKVWAEIKQDFGRKQVMSRLIQGDVGSGKTILAFLALIMTAENGRQGALMVPTEVLARQHFEAYQQLKEMCSLPFEAVLLTGSLKAKEKRQAQERIARNEVSIVIGTHALFQEKANYGSLSLVITDEQHRFGVRQRENLGEKGDYPHTLVMSATPIPRTLAVILYGDLDISILDQQPKNRIPIKNCVIGPKDRPKAYTFLKKQLSLGHQCYVICPLTEMSELMEGENVVDYARMLSDVLGPDVHVEYLHGKLKAEEKNRRMEAFIRGEINVLVSTTVIEVGINVPNATVMMIENADHYGLAQLHQLRGRVGRGKWQSYCIFLQSQDRQEVSPRLDILAKTNDGFVVAEQDLKLRGPGEMMGVRQSGALEFALADVFSDANILTKASRAAEGILKKDADLSGEEYGLLRQKIQDQLQNEHNHLSI